jgi:hypothetical protein
MARVQGVKEKLHSPIYDAFMVKEGTKFSQSMTDSRVIRFFVDVQNKTRLETNLQASGVLPSQNTFEARAMRVIAANRRFDAPTGSSNDANDSEVLADLIYNSVTSLIVGEKVMIEMPTFWFPGGAGVTHGRRVTNHGEATPEATFRFAEPVVIEPQQNFRVELSFPQGVPSRDPQKLSNDGKTKSDPPERLGDVLGPFRIWVVLDGYLTRDVQ